MILCMGGNIHLFSSAWLCGHLFCAKIQKKILVMSLNCDVHLAEQKLVSLTVVLVDLKRRIYLILQTVSAWVPGLSRLQLRYS